MKNWENLNNENQILIFYEKNSIIILDHILQNIHFHWLTNYIIKPIFFTFCSQVLTDLICCCSNNLYFQTLLNSEFFYQLCSFKSIHDRHVQVHEDQTITILAESACFFLSLFNSHLPIICKILFVNNDIYAL